jgi:hypothetical protein
VAWGLATDAAGHYVATRRGEVRTVGPKMSGSVVQVIAFVVLAAIVLATGFSAL